VTLPPTAVIRLVAVAIAVLIGLTMLLLEAGGFDSAVALRALWNGSFGSSYALTSATLVRAIPLVLTGLAVALAFQAGVFNISAEGQLLTGAAVSAVIGAKLGTVLCSGSQLSRTSSTSQYHCCGGGSSAHDLVWH
jgi:ABC-type uncharacterized transport system permease subunit